MSSAETNSGAPGTMQDHRPDYDRAQLHAYVVSHINEAVDNGWVKPFYQPVIRSITGKVCGFEALARWDDPTYGLLPPDAFIPALEEARVIHLLDSSIIRQVCRQYRDCADRGEPVVPISLNLSRLDFDLCDIFGVVEEAAHEFAVPRRMLNIEITESALGADPDYMTAMMGKFHDTGYQVWMDDFGSGYSTLNVLKDFDFDELKMDMEFLSRFGEKSRTILASVVDMAKKLGIQTLAEGVETEEHRDYLQRIGCEKMQGYLFGKPRPYSADMVTDLIGQYGAESTTERLYLDKVGAVNTLSMSERDLTPNSSKTGYVTSMPLALVEFYDDKFNFISTNRVFREGLANVGIDSVEKAQRLINNMHRPLARQTRRVMATIETDKFARIDYVTGGVPCVLRIKHITSSNGKMALLISIDDTIEFGERKRHERMDDALTVMYSIYDHVDIIHLGEGFIEPVFGNIGLRAQFDAPAFDNVTRHFAESEIYVRDRERYMEFMDHDSMVERIMEGGENFITNFFRFRQHGGDYAWKMVALIHIANVPGDVVMYCVRSTHWRHDGLFQAAYDGGYDEQPYNLENLETPDLSVNDGSLWQAIMRSKSMSLFWKDKDRRFIGANQSFLDYYGFSSVNEIIGKTDEDMGWHIDPEPFKNDEWRVINEGAYIEDVMGQCIVNGQVRNIVANKRPVYRNGHIVGLVGYFIDIDEEQESNGELDSLPLRDSVTGVLNFTGLEAATWRYVDAYKRQGLDFAIVSINIESLDRINAEFGYSFGDKVLKRIAEELVSVAGHQRVVGHVFSDRFAVLAQGDSDDALQGLCDEIESRLLAISQVDGTPCTVYALAGFARFSQFGDVEAMKRHNRDRRQERRNGEGGLPNGDGAASSLKLAE